MAGRLDNLHSRVIAWLKVLLPLAAMGIVAALFLTSRSIDPEAALTGAGIDVRELARQVRISNPDYSGMTEDGTAVRLSAASARPDPARPGWIGAEDVVALLEAADGTLTTLRGNHAELDRAADRFTLSGAVEVATSTGYRMLTEELTASLTRGELHSDLPVRAEAPYGELTAGSMRLSPGAEAGQVLVFNGGVKLIYRPTY